jgi:hypothetical protein
MTRIRIRHASRAEQDSEQRGQPDVIERVKPPADVPTMTNDQIRQEMDELRAAILHHAAALNGFQEGTLGPRFIRHEQLRAELSRRGVSRFGPQ